MNHLHKEVDPQAYVNLIADCPAEKLYRRSLVLWRQPPKVLGCT